MLVKESNQSPYRTVISKIIRGGSTVRTDYGTFDGHSQRIEYAEGPKYSFGRLNWKHCKHQVTLRGDVGPMVWQQDGPVTAYATCPLPQYPSSSVPGVSDEMIAEATESVVSQLDLNCSDGVLLYSGILQAVPLVGGCFKFVSIMNRVAKKLSRDMRRKPFTTALKTAISLDFIDRFVVSPTIDDARKFLDAHNYVVRVMNTLAERSSQPVALNSSVSNVIESSTTSFAVNSRMVDMARFSGVDVYKRASSIELFTLIEANYDAGAVSPFKLWAARTGITTPLDSVWDLVPFSFVLDYFMRAGDFISGLGQEMSSQDGLRGRIGNILGQWSCIKAECTRTRKVNSCTQNYGPGIRGFSPFEIKLGRSTFERAPIPFNRILGELQSFDSSLIHWDLTNRRAGTLVELFLQAKL